MATAPTPSSTADVEPSRKLKIRINERELLVDFADVGPGDDLAARQQCGIPVTPFLDENTVAADSVLVLVWLALRKNGEPVRYERLLEDYPTYRHIADSIEISVLEEDVPEA